MRVVYCKRNKFKVFGIKIFEWVTDFNQRISETDEDENDFYIELKEVENERGN